MNCKMGRTTKVTPVRFSAPATPVTRCQARNCENRYHDRTVESHEDGITGVTPDNTLDCEKCRKYVYYCMNFKNWFHTDGSPVCH